MTLKFTILGCGTSSGVPRIGGDWGNCDPANPKNRRLRCSLLVERIGSRSQLQICQIALGLIGQKPGQLGRLPQSQRQQAGRHRIESATMPDPALAGDPPHLVDHIERGHSGGLVDQEPGALVPFDEPLFFRAVVQAVTTSFFTAPTARIALSGGLIIAVK